MAYSNWGAFVFKGDERQRDREDVPVFGDPDVERVGSGARIWVHLLKQKRAGTLEKSKPWDDCHHAVLGSGQLRLCAYKAYPRIYFVDDYGNVEELEIERFKVDAEDPPDGWSFYDSEGIRGEHRGFKFSATPGHDPERVELRLEEPDGTVWTGKSGYAMGAGYEE